MPNLPVAVAESGRAVVRVLEWQQHQGLSTATQYEIGHAVEVYPWLDEETRVDMLADAAGFFGEPIDRMLIELVELYGSVERVYFAIEALYELGERGRDGGKRTSLVWLLDLLNTCDEEHVPITNVETLDALAQQFEYGIFGLLAASFDEALEERRRLGTDEPDADEEDDDQ